MSESVTVYIATDTSCIAGMGRTPEEAAEAWATIFADMEGGPDTPSIVSVTGTPADLRRILKALEQHGECSVIPYFDRVGLNA